MRDEIVLFRSTSKPAADFTAAVTDIITSAAHGLQNGNMVQLTTTDTLPAGLAVSTNYYVINTATNTFKLSATPGGSAVDITDTGTGTHTFHLKGKVIYTGDWKDISVSLHFSSTPTMTVKFQGSIADDAPDFNAAQSPTNRWDYIDVVDLQNGTSIDGDTGVACAGTADDRLFEVNVNNLAYMTVAITSYTAGYLDVRVKTFNAKAY